MDEIELAGVAHTFCADCRALIPTGELAPLDCDPELLGVCADCTARHLTGCTHCATLEK